MTTETKGNRAAGEAKKARKTRFTDIVWEKLIAEADELHIPVAEHLRRIVDDHLNRESFADRGATRLRNLERRMADMEARMNSNGAK